MFAVYSLSKIQDSQGKAPYMSTSSTDKQSKRNKIWLTKTFRHGPELTPPSKHPPYQTVNQSLQRNLRFSTMLIYSNFTQLHWQMLRLHIVRDK